MCIRRERAKAMSLALGGPRFHGERFEWKDRDRGQWIGPERQAGDDRIAVVVLA